MEMLNKVEMGRRIKEIRKGAGLRQWQLAKILGTTQSAVHKYEHGVIPEPRRLVKLAHLGQTTIEWILTGQHWENGSQTQERLSPETYRLAERLRKLGPEQQRTLDDALRIITDAVEAMREPAGSGNAGMELGELASQLALLPEKQKAILSAALRVHRAVLRSVLDLEMERLERSDLASRLSPADQDSKERP